MVLKLKSLTESIEKKYLNESSLTEKYSDSMPSWLQDRLNYTQYQDRYENTRDVSYPVLKADRAETDKITGAKEHRGYWLDQADKASPFRDKKNQSRPTYQYRGSANRGDNQSNSLYYNFRKMGIPLDKVKVIEGPVPTQGSDPRLKEPNIPIFLLDQGQVYAKGINDSEIDLDTDKGFKYTPMKSLLAKAKAFAYIDGEDSSNFNAFDVKAGRQNKAQDWRKYERNRADSVNDEGQITKGFDKSGYPVPIDKWEKSNATYLSQYAKKQLEVYREKLVDVIDSYKTFQSTLFDTLKDDNTKMGDYQGWYERADIGNVNAAEQRDIYQSITRARIEYTKALQAAAEEEAERLNDYISAMLRYIDHANELMQNTGLMPEKLSVIDWI